MDEFKETVPEYTELVIHEQIVLTRDDLAKFVEDIFKNYLLPVLNAKGKDYRVSDCLKESIDEYFSKISSLIGSKISLYEVWAVLFSKHMVSIFNWISTGELQSESLESRLTDAINYLIILWGIAYAKGVMPHPSTHHDA